MIPANVRLLTMAAVFALPLCSASAAEPARQTAVVAWSTYLREGPGAAYAVISELEHDTPVVVLGGAGRWRRVSDGTAQGYVDQDALTLSRTSAPSGAPARGDCVVVGQADNRGPIATRFCSAPAAPGR